MNGSRGVPGQAEVAHQVGEQGAGCARAHSRRALPAARRRHRSRSAAAPSRPAGAGAGHPGVPAAGPVNDDRQSAHAPTLSAPRQPGTVPMACSPASTTAPSSDVQPQGCARLRAAGQRRVSSRSKGSRSSAPAYHRLPSRRRRRPGRPAKRLSRLGGRHGAAGQVGAGLRPDVAGGHVARPRRLGRPPGRTRRTMPRPSASCRAGSPRAACATGHRQRSSAAPPQRRASRPRPS